MNILADPTVSSVLESLHKKSDLDRVMRLRHKKEKFVDKSFKETAYLSILPEQGRLLYSLSTIASAKTIVEYGCSFGVSSLYLAAAAKCNGGRLITTDIESGKVEESRKNLMDAGLMDYADVLLGNALETLTDIEAPIDFLFLDGANDLYLPIFKKLHSRLGIGAIVVADNANKGGASGYVKHVISLAGEFTSLKFFDDRMLVSYRS
jgi:predicted O-methyltransferase YrrM